VINGVSFQIMLISKLIWNLKGCIVDVETAFLHGELQEEIYMNIPEGMNSESNNCLLLSKTIYGHVQSAKCRRVLQEIYICTQVNWVQRQQV
jgi:Reverse transcriptase (RNA-dependent DNA polymerase)